MQKIFKRGGGTGPPGLPENTATQINRKGLTIAIQ